MTSKPGVGLTRSRWEVLNQDREVVMTMEGYGMFGRRPVPVDVVCAKAFAADAAATVKAGWRGDKEGRSDGPIVVNSSRAILYASAQDDFAQAARRAAQATRRQLHEAR